MDWRSTLENAVFVVVIPLIVWNVKTLLEVRTTLFGADGTNGIRSRVTKLEENDARQDIDIAVLQSQHKEAA